MSTIAGKPVGYLCLALSMVLVGVSVPVGKVLVAIFPVFILSLVRFIAASSCSVPLAAVQVGLRFRLDPRGWLILAAQCVTGTFLFNIFLMYGVKYTDALSAGVILSTMPAVAGVLAALLLREKLGRRQYQALLLSVAGLVLVNTAGAAASGSSLLGNLLVFGAVVTEGIFLATTRILVGRMPAQQQAVVLNLGAIVMFLPFAAWQARDFDFSGPHLADWALAAGHGIATAIIAVLLYYRGLRDVPVAQAAPFTGLIPVSAAAVAILVLGETLTWPVGLGMVLVLAAIWVGTRPQS